MNQTQYSKLEKIYFLFLVLCTGSQVSFSQALMYPVAPVITALFAVMTLKVALDRKVSFHTKELRIPLCIVGVWAIAQFIKQGYLTPMFAFLVYEIVIAYVVVKIFNEDIFYLFEKYTVWLASINLVVWGAYLIMPGVIESVLSPFNLAQPNNVMKIRLIFTSISGSSDIIGMRNAGFASEPGHYACLLCIAILFNLLRTNFSIKHNRSLYILLASIVSTQSTTGVGALGVLVLLYIYNTRASSRYLTTIATVIILPSVIALPFVGEKINELAYTDDSIYEITRMGESVETNGEGVFVPQRIDGFVLECMNVKEDPLLGYGLKEEDSYVGKHLSSNISLANGIVKIFSSLGLILGALFIWYLFKSMKYITSIYDGKGYVIVAFFYCAISFSYNFNFFPLLLAIWQYYWFTGEYKQNEKKYDTRTLC